MLTEILLRQFRCFERVQVEFAPGRTCIVGPNAHGKTSLLEAACVLLRLQSPRATTLGQAIRFGQKGFALEGRWERAMCQYYYSSTRRKLVLDAVEQRRANEYLQLSRVVWFGNDDLDLLRGGSDGRRKFLDFVIIQTRPVHRLHLRSYEKALRSRNILLKTGASSREIAAYDGPLIQAGEKLRQARLELIEQLGPLVDAANRQISGLEQALRLEYRDGTGSSFATALATSAAEERRLRQTIVGPHRDDLRIEMDGKPMADFGSEGQQRTAVLALKLAQTSLLSIDSPTPPLLLIDDVFGELDPARRNRLFTALPPAAQQIITTTHLDWAEDSDMKILRIEEIGR